MGKGEKYFVKKIIKNEKNINSQHFARFDNTTLNLLTNITRSATFPI